MELKETQAGQQLYSALATLVEKQLELLRRIDKKRKAALDPELVQELQTEYSDLQAQIDDKLRQMQQLKVPLLKRFFNTRRGTHPRGFVQATDEPQIVNTKGQHTDDASAEYVIKVLLAKCLT